MLVLKVRSMCVAVEVVGESTAVALEVAQVTPNQLGNVCLRQYLSNRSLGKTSDAKAEVPPDESGSRGGERSCGVFLGSRLCFV